MYVGGHLTWTDGTHIVRIPLVVRPVALAAPAEVTFNTAAGPVELDGQDRLRGHRSPRPSAGSSPRPRMRGRSPQDPDRTGPGAADTQGTFVRSTVTSRPVRRSPASGSTRTRSRPQGNDLDLFVCSGSSLVGVLGGRRLQRGGDVHLRGASHDAHCVHRVRPRVRGRDRATAEPPRARCSTGRFRTTDAGNTTLAITPAGNATIGGTKTITATFSGLAPATRYLGAVRLQRRQPAIGSHDRSRQHAVAPIRVGTDEGPAQAGPSLFRQE